MNLTRVETKALQAAVANAKKKLEEAIAELEPWLPILPDAVRLTVPKPRTGFEAAARVLAAESTAHPDVVAATEYDAGAVVEDLDNVDSLVVLNAPIARLQQMLDDGRLLWLAEAYVPSLEFYGVAKVGAKKNGKLAQAIGPIADVFSTPRRRAAEPQK